MDEQGFFAGVRFLTIKDTPGFAEDPFSLWVFGNTGKAHLSCLDIDEEKNKKGARSLQGPDPLFEKVAGDQGITVPLYDVHPGLGALAKRRHAVFLQDIGDARAAEPGDAQFIKLA